MFVGEVSDMKLSTPVMSAANRQLNGNNFFFKQINIGYGVFVWGRPFMNEGIICMLVFRLLYLYKIVYKSSIYSNVSVLFNNFGQRASWFNCIFSLQVMLYQQIIAFIIIRNEIIKQNLKILLIVLYSAISGRLMIDHLVRMIPLTSSFWTTFSFNFKIVEMTWPILLGTNLT